MLWTENNLSISSGKRTREQAAKPWGAEEMKSSHHLSQTLLPCLVLLATCNSRFQVTGMIEWRQKSKPQKIPRASNKRKKIPGPKFNLPKIPRRISEPLKFPEELHSQDTRGSDAGTVTNVQIVLKDCFERSDCSKKSLLKSTYPKKYMPKFLDPKKTRNWKFHTHKNPSIIPVTWNLEYPPPPSDGCPLYFRPSEQSGGKFVHNTNKRGHHSLSLILSEDHKWLIFDFFCFEASKPMPVAIVTIVKLIKPDVKIAANQVIFTTCSF